MKRPPIEATLPTPLNPVATGDADADEALAALQSYPMSPHTPVKRPTGEEYEALVARAEALGPERLLPLLDDAAVATGGTSWDDDPIDALPAKERRAFKKDYQKALAAVAVRKAYLHWLIGAVCQTEAGLARAIALARDGTIQARLTAMDVLAKTLTDGGQRRRVGEAVDLREWDGEHGHLETVYRFGVALFSAEAPEEVFERYQSVLADSSGWRRSALFAGLAASGRVDPRWVDGVLDALSEPSVLNQAAGVLKHLEPDASWVEPLCAALPHPSKPGGFWNRGLLEPLARAADARALPWLLAALSRSKMVYEPVFEGLRRVGDARAAHAVRDFLADGPPPAAIEPGKALIAELEKGGVAPRLEVVVPAAKAPARKRPVLTYAKARKPKHPPIEPLAELERVYAKAFDEAGLEGAYEKLAQRAVLMLPTRVKEAELAIGATRLGGHPDLPAGVDWPRVRKEPLTFVAQIDLAEVAPLLDGRLPETGLLSFFLANDPEGEAGYCEAAKVLFTEPGAGLVRREVPEDFVDLIYQAARVELHATVTLPSPTNKHVSKVLRGKKRETYEEVFEACDAFEPVVAQLLGFRRHGWDAEEPGTSEMLLQLPGDDQTGMQFGDIDVLGIYVARKRLEAGDFSKVRPRLGDG